MAFSFGNVSTASTAPAFGAAPSTTAFSFSTTGGTPTAPSTSPFATSTPSSFTSPFATQAAPPAAAISGSMLYSQLPPEMKQAIDRLHEAMTRHRKTMVQLQSMGPELLQPSSSVSSTPLQEQLQQAQSHYQRLAHEFAQLETAVSTQHAASQEALTQATLYAAWPVEGLAARQGVRLTPPRDASSDRNTTQQLLEEARTRAVARVDTIHRMPSPYYWDQLQTLEQRAAALLDALSKTTPQPRIASAEEMTFALEEQDLMLQRVTAQVQRLQADLQRLRVQYRLYETSRGGVNVLDQRAIQEQERQRKLQEQVLLQYVQATQQPQSSSQSANASSSGPAAASPFGTTTPSASALSAFGGTTAFGTAPTAFGATPATNLFGAPAPATTTTAFGAPAPTTTAFGSTTAPAPAFGSTTPAPAFGSTAAAPAPAFGSTTPAPAAFGSATPAPVTTPAFGAATPAPVTTPAFGSFASSSTSTANKKNKGSSRNLGRVRR